MSCLNSTYCVLTYVYPYDGEYNFAGTYNSQDYFTGGTYFIYYSTSENKWCLSDSLGGSCYQFGPLLSGSDCPDLDSDFFSVGPCPATTTTTTSPCDVFDFEALFDCIIPTTTTTTTTIPPTTTTTTTIFDPCEDVDIKISIDEYPTTTTTTLPVTTTTTTINRPCNFDGTAQFNIFDQYLRCANSKAFRDCLNGFVYFSSEILLTPEGISPTQEYVYKINVNGVSTCATFIGLNDSISGIDNIVIVDEIGPENEGGCLECLPDPPPTTTTTSTSTTTTTTIPPCVLYEYQIVNNAPFEQEYSYINCDDITTIDKVNRPPHNVDIVCAKTTPTSASPFVQINPTGNICL